MAENLGTNISYLNRLGEGLSAYSPNDNTTQKIDIPEAATEEVASKEQINSDNAVFVVQGRIALEAVEDKIIIMLDPFRTGFECKECDGTGIGKECYHCHGTGKNRFDGPCKVCEGNPHRWLGLECPGCKGIGSLLVIPESAKQLPTSGRIVSMGPKCEKGLDGKTIKKIGQRYLFGIHVGYFLPFKGNILLRCLREHEVMCRVYSLDKHIAMGDYFAVPDETANMGSE